DQLDADPADRLTLDDEVRRALTVLLDRLSPAERTSFVLHDVFGFPFDAVAELVGRTPGACRQLARRARLSLGAPEPARRAAPVPAESAALADRFIAACAGGDVGALVGLLDPAADGLAIVLGLGAPAETHGVPAVAERAIAFFGPAAGVTLAPFALEGHAGVLARRGDAVVAVIRLDERAGRIRHLHAIALPLFPA
ncbi:sigma factor-like helix-turn-helix DNA-binding protein, partial [Actinocatenispora thailandica]|uniref:sigma factor-like helix-turn-helix DNA-binding protein n=1 Tax=Actinocatenispora thailandica TaxID=227318 RepID=UPI0031D3378C